ncbi:metaxin 1, partial [Sarracenia purpurea var. burkii]
MDEEVKEREEMTLVARKACFGLPTACPSCLPVYIYLKFAQFPFSLDFNLVHPDSDQIPYVESGTYVAYNNEKGGVIEILKEDGIVDLDFEVQTVPEWISTKAMVNSWLADALMYELWVGSDGSSAQKIYYSDLPWPIGKFLYFKQICSTKQLLGITQDNTDRREEEIYRRATIAYGALSTRLGDQAFLFENRPTSLDAVFLGHALCTLQALPETSVLRSKLLEHSNLVRYADKLKREFVEAGSSSSVPLFHADQSASFSRPGGSSHW